MEKLKISETEQLRRNVMYDDLHLRLIVNFLAAARSGEVKITEEEYNVIAGVHNIRDRVPPFKKLPDDEANEPLPQVAD